MNKIKHTALLSRLSKEDEINRESESIQTQKAMLEEYAYTHGFKNIIHYSDDGISDFTPFKNIMNEWYAKDISKKIRSAYKTKALKGEFTASYAPYRYMKDPMDKHHLIIDLEASLIVKEIFEYVSLGKSSYEIASILTKRKILKPRAYMNSKYNSYRKDIWNNHPYDWKATSIVNMVSNYEYCGHMVNNKNCKKSYKTKGLIKNDDKDWIIDKNTHEAIVSEDLYKHALMSIPFYGTRMTSKIPTIFNVAVSYEIDNIFDSTKFMTSAKATLLGKASKLGLAFGYGLTAWQYINLIKAIATKPDFENSRWILY